MHDTLRAQQFALARHVRDPDRHPPPPGIERRRARVYRELFFNNIESLLSSGFPVIRETLGVDRWRQRVRAFFATHRSRTPLFPLVASEFVDYLSTVDDPRMPAWLPELAHYEWMEQKLFTSDAAPPPHDPGGDLLDGVLAWSPLAMPLAYAWPVTDIGPGHVPKGAPAVPTTLLVHRDAANEVRFARITPLAYQLMAQVQATPRTGRAHIAELARTLGVEASDLEPHALPLLVQLHAQGVIPGTVIESALGRR